jgi:exosortase
MGMPVQEESVAATEVASPPEERAFDFNAIVRSPAFVPGVLITVGFLLLYIPLIGNLWGLWTADDGYYSHGFLVPLISAYVVYRWWPRIKDIAVKPAYLAVVPLALLTYVAFRAGALEINMVLGACLIASLLMAAAFMAGWKWMLVLSPAILYLAFAMPFWNAAIDAYTNPLQIYSSHVAYAMLQVGGLNPIRGDSTTIYVGNFIMDVGVPCSGLKLVLALTAFVTFFVLIARLRWWANGLMVSVILPLALLVNGLRIAMIGVVGANYGDEAGHQFHDYSGYITLLVCFFILFKFARLLGWKD